MASPARGAVFLSYAREDSPAARRIADAIRGFGIDVWFDQSELRGGDVWDAHIKRQIRECALFIPLISANSEARHEGYFRREWNLAVDRMLDMAHDAPFLLPISIDETWELTARVPDRFRSVQWLRMSDGVPTPEIVSHVKRLLEAPGRSASPFVRASETNSPHVVETRRDSRPPIPASRAHKFQLAGVTVVAVAAVLVAVWQWSERRGLEVQRADVRRAEAPVAAATRAGPISSKSVAVLAFADMSPGKDSEFFADGISEELLNVLAKVPNLHVPARTSSFSFKGKNLPIAEIAHKLGVAYVVEGSVRRQGDRVRITAQLIDASTGYHLWSDNFEHELKNVFAVQDEIAREIAQILRLKINDAPRGTKTVNPDAHRLVLEGRHYWNLRNEGGFARNEEGFARAEAAFKKALTLDSQYAEAYAGLAEVYVVRANFRQFDGIGETANDLARAKIEAQRAIELDPRLAEPHAALGFAARLEGRLADAERHFQMALALNPRSAVIYNWYALLLACRGKLDGAIEAYSHASVLDPLWFINLHRHAWHLTRARRFKEALQVNEQAALLLKDVHVPHRADHALVLFELGHKSEAIDAARQVVQLVDKQPRWQADSDAISLLRRAGLQNEAEAHAARLLQQWPADSYNRGFVLTALGRFDEALPFLERTPAAPARGLFWDAMWDPYRNDPRFRQLLVKLGLAADYDMARATLARLLRQSSESPRKAE